MLALHSSQNLNGGQFYIGCAQLKIAGSGSGTCGPTIELPGAYKAEDKNIYIPNYYNGFDLKTYKAPGGAVASCGGAGGAAPAPSTPAGGNETTPTVPSTTAKPSAVVEATPKPTPSKSVGGGESPVASQAPVASSAPAPAPVPSTGSGAGETDGALPASFTIKTFIEWLESKAGSAGKARRHARAF
jgi:cellulase